jgi:hypothetical protein
MNNIDNQKLRHKNLNAPDQKSALIVNGLTPWPKKSLVETFMRNARHTSSFTSFHI